jgi:hypothetical protein
LYINPVRNVDSTGANSYLTYDTTSREISYSTGSWFTYTPSFTSRNGDTLPTTSTLQGRYKQIGKTVFFNMYIVFSSTSGIPSVGDQWRFSYPVTPQSTTSLSVSFSFYNVTNGGNYFGVANSVMANPVSTSYFVLLDNIATVINNGAPATWNSADYILVSGSYEVA